jgi:hypothetical protein
MSAVPKASKKLSKKAFKHPPSFSLTNFQVSKNLLHQHLPKLLSSFLIDQNITKRLAQAHFELKTFSVSSFYE